MYTLATEKDEKKIYVEVSSLEDVIKLIQSLNTDCEITVTFDSDKERIENEEGR